MHHSIVPSLRLGKVRFPCSRKQQQQLSIELGTSWSAIHYPHFWFFTYSSSSNITISPPDPIQGAMVGNPQDISCTVSTVMEWSPFQ